MEDRAVKKLMGAALAAALCACPALAQDKKPAEKPTDQQKRTADCSRQAADKHLQGRERSQFMSMCMRGEKPMTGK